MWLFVGGVTCWGANVPVDLLGFYRCPYLLLTLAVVFDLPTRAPIEALVVVVVMFFFRAVPWTKRSCSGVKADVPSTLDMINSITVALRLGLILTRLPLLRTFI